MRISVAIDEIKFIPIKIRTVDLEFVAARTWSVAEIATMDRQANTFQQQRRIHHE